MLTIVCGPSARAFDTGHHQDLTRDALSAEGFSTANDTAIRIAEFQNWVTDYYSSHPIRCVEPINDNKVCPKTGYVRDDVEKLHFDNLFTTADVREYWRRLALNTYTGVRAATLKRDHIRLMTIIGVSLHAVQDFYTHSNWNEVFPRQNPDAPYRTVTWFDVENSGGVTQRVFTGWYQNDLEPVRPRRPLVDGVPGTEAPVRPHDDLGPDLPPPLNGLNKDSYRRRGWDEAYVFAYAASRQWLNAIRTWVSEVDPFFWNELLDFELSSRLSSQLEDDISASYRLSELAPRNGENSNPPDSGHWKGPGSGAPQGGLGSSIPLLKDAFRTRAANWARKPDSCFVDQLKEVKVHRDLSYGLYTNLPMLGTPPRIQPHPVNVRAMVVGTVAVQAINTKRRPPEQPSFLARITVGGVSQGVLFVQTFVESAQRDNRGPSVKPAESDNRPQNTLWPWRTIKFVPADVNSVTVNYGLRDEEVNRVAGEEIMCDINHVFGDREIDFSFNLLTQVCSGDINGIFSESNPVSVSGIPLPGDNPSRGDGNETRVNFFVTVRAVR